MLYSVLYAFIFTTLFAGSLFANDISADALTLALRAQEQIKLDSSFAVKVDSGLVAARNTTEAINNIHAIPDYDPYMMILKTEATWSQSWKDGNVFTGEKFIDSLSLEFKLDSVVYRNRFSDYFLLYFAEPLKISLLAEMFEKQDDIVWAEPNGTIGDGNNIEMVQLNDSLHLAFSLGWGDCLAGCINRYYWYISVYKTDSSYNGVQQEERPREFTTPYLYRWNIPDRYPITMFMSIDSILSQIESSEVWWIKRHCIESLWRLYAYDYPWVGEDLQSRSVWDTLKSELSLKHNDILGVLNRSIGDSVRYVRESANFALDKIQTITHIEAAIIPEQEIVVNNYPNPFNAITTFEISVPRNQNINLDIYNILGQKVATILSEVSISGTYKVFWDASLYAGGIYIYRLVSKNQIKHGKILFVK